jgi:hypothetical protein
MAPEGIEKRRAVRYPIQVGAAVELRKNGRSVHATTVNISDCGVLLEFQEPLKLVIGEDVVCEFQLTETPQASIPYWALGTVVRVEDSRAAIDLSAGGFRAWPPPADQ